MTDDSPVTFAELEEVCRKMGEIQQAMLETMDAIVNKVEELTNAHNALVAAFDEVRDADNNERLANLPWGRDN